MATSRRHSSRRSYGPRSPAPFHCAGRGTTSSPPPSGPPPAPPQLVSESLTGGWYPMAAKVAARSARGCAGPPCRTPRRRNLAFEPDRPQRAADGRGSVRLFQRARRPVPRPQPVRHRHVFLRARRDAFPRDLSRQHSLCVAAARHRRLAGIDGVVHRQADAAASRLYPRGRGGGAPADLRPPAWQRAVARARRADAPARRRHARRPTPPISASSTRWAR